VWNIRRAVPVFSVVDIVLSAEQTAWDSLLCPFHNKQIQASRWCNQVMRMALVLMFAALGSGSAQALLDSEARLTSSDLAALEPNQSHKTLSCQVEPQKPYLGFDLRLHASYRASVPVEALAAGGHLQEVIRVRPKPDGKPVLFVRRIEIPSFATRSTGMRAVDGGFDIGPGRYEVDWMMRESGGRVCSSHWKLDVGVGSRGRKLPLTVLENMVAPSLASPFANEPPRELQAGQTMHLKILLNVSPVDSHEGVLSPQYLSVLLSMLRGIVREPVAGRLSLLAFNLRAQKIVYKEENGDANAIDFRALGKAIESPAVGTIDYRLLQDPQSETHFVTSLLADQLGAGNVSHDAIIIVGPRLSLERKVPLDALRERGAAPCPIFYLSYNPNPFEERFADTIGFALKAYSTASKYDITRPGDFGTALKVILDRLGRLSTPEAVSSE